MNICTFMREKHFTILGENIDPYNKIMSYRGGGYDGCHWEPNFLHIDRNGEIHDIYSSGYRGVFQYGQPRANVLEKTLYNPRKYSQEDMHDVDFYDPCLQNDMIRLGRSIAAIYLFDVYKYLWQKEANEEDWDIAYACDCDNCRNIQNTMPKFAEGDGNIAYLGINMEGFGGIAGGHTGLACEVCYAARLCEGCKTIDSRDPSIYPMFNVPNGGYTCMECTECAVHQIYGRITLPEDEEVFDCKYVIDKNYAAQMNDKEIQGKLKEIDVKLASTYSTEDSKKKDYLEYVRLSYSGHFLRHELQQRQEVELNG